MVAKTYLQLDLARRPILVLEPFGDAGPGASPHMYIDYVGNAVPPSSGCGSRPQYFVALYDCLVFIPIILSASTFSICIGKGYYRESREEIFYTSLSMSRFYQNRFLESKEIFPGVVIPNTASRSLLQ